MSSLTLVSAVVALLAGAFALYIHYATQNKHKHH